MKVCNSSSESCKLETYKKSTAPPKDADNVLLSYESLEQLRGKNSLILL